MYNFFVILVIIASVLMCLIVLIQESKGGGLASGFASGNQVMGVRKTTDVIEKITWGLAIAMVVFSVASVYCLPSATRSGSVMEDAVQTAPVPAASEAIGADAINATATDAAPAAELPQTPAN